MYSRLSMDSHPVDASRLLESAVAHHQAGHFKEAEALYRQILTANPRDAQAMHLLGVLGHQIGRTDEGVEWMRRSIGLNPSVASWHSNLGVALASLRRTDEAIEAHRTAVRLDPGSPEMHFNLAGSLLESGRPAEAETEYRVALALRPNYAEAINGLGGVHRQLGQFAEAERNYREAGSVRSDYAEPYCNLSDVLRRQGRLDDAITAARRALEIQPAFPEALHNLGTAFQEKGEPAQAILLYQQAIAHRPDRAETLFNLGVALQETGRHDDSLAALGRVTALQPNHTAAFDRMGTSLRLRGRLDEAAAAYRKVMSLRPEQAGAVNNLGIVCSEQGRIDEAAACFRRAIELDPNFAGAFNNLGNTLKDTGRIREATACYERSLALSPDPYVASNRLYSLHFDADLDAHQLLHEHRQWDLRYGSPAPIAPHPNDRSPERRLRVGYVSPDLREHPVGRFLLPLLTHHNHEKFEIFCYCDGTRPDAVTTRLRSHADVWRNTVGMSDAALADLVRQDGIDILVDLAMHMDGTRMRAFAAKPAAVQVTYLAYCGTTGLRTMDWRLTDPWLDPPGSDDSRYSERSMRLPRTYWCYEPPEVAPEISPPPFLSAGHVTFGCLNNFCKLTEPTIAAWFQIMRAMPDAALLLHSGEGSHRQRLRDRFRDAGVDPSRITFVSKTSLALYFEQYQRIDIALDPFPYPGGTTTCDALWMGVPVVTRAGSTAVSRGGLSILSNIGLPELVTSDTDQYIRTTLDLAADPARLGELRRSLRARMKSSPLMDAPQFALDVEAAFRQMWREWAKAAT